MTVAASDELDRLDVSSLDPGRMLDTIVASPQDWARGLELALAAPSPPAGAPFAVVCGMGGSGIAGDVAAVAARSAGRAALLVSKSGHLPAAARAGALVVAVSYSGDTAETLAVFEEATVAGLPRIAVTSGGTLGRRAVETGATLLTVPGGRMPRAALPYLATAALVALERAGVIEGATGELAAAPAASAAAVTAYGPEAPLETNHVKQLAAMLAAATPLFLGMYGWPALVAARAKTQVHENAKRVAFASELPEFDHNEIVGLASDPRGVTVVTIRGAVDEAGDGALAAAATAALLRRAKVAVAELTLPHDPSGIGRFAAGVTAVDLLSVYLAFLGGVDPTPIEPITQLKAELAKTRNTPGA